MGRNRKRRQKKTYRLKELEERWKQENFDEKKLHARIGTIGALLGAFLLAFLFIISCFIGGLYQPIEKEEAVSREVQLERFGHYRSRHSRLTHYLVLTDGTRIYLPDTYFRGNQSIKSALEALPTGTTLHLKSHPDGTVLEIKTETKEILNFDTAQEQQFQSSVFTLIIGILSFLGMIPCVVYAWIKIFRDKVFHRKKQISPHRIK